MTNTFLKYATILLASISITGCMTFQPIEPIKKPPLEFRKDTVAAVEFVHPTKVGFRCAQRGAKFLALPGINSAACSSTDLVTMPNPCMTFTGGWYAELLCHELAHANGWSANHNGGNWLPDEFVYGEKAPMLASLEKDETDAAVVSVSAFRPASESPQAIAAQEAKEMLSIKVEVDKELEEDFAQSQDELVEVASDTNHQIVDLPTSDPPLSASNYELKGRTVVDSDVDVVVSVTEVVSEENQLRVLTSDVFTEAQSEPTSETTLVSYLD